MKSPIKVCASLCSPLLALLISGCSSTAVLESDLSWDDQLERQLPRLGKNSWIVIADAAYPAGHVAGVEVIVAPKPVTTVLDFVLDTLGDSQGVGATAWLSAELERIPDRDAPEIGRLHKDLCRALNAAKVEIKVAAEEEITKKVAADSAAYRTIVIRTTTPKPYSSVYLSLNCKYWDAAREKRLRDALRGTE